MPYHKQLYSYKQKASFLSFILETDPRQISEIGHKILVDPEIDLHRLEYSVGLCKPMIVSLPNKISH